MSAGPVRSRLRRAGRVALFVLVTWLLATVVDVRAITWPAGVGTALLPPVAHDPAFDASEPTLVVLQHGLARSSWSMERIAKALRAHGYEVMNPGYPSTWGDLDRHAAALAVAIETRLANAEATPRLAFVGHSLGGLVIRAYLERDDARTPHACCFLGTPQRGAVLATWHARFAAFPLFVGGAAWQLLPSDPIHERLGRVEAANVGVLYGHRGDGEGWSNHIPGDDDRRVGVAEAQLPEQTAVKGLPIGHFELGHGPTVQREVLAFLRTGAFLAD